ncbi:MAG: NCS2 family permease [Corallococcus sp.]|nr:NCS2 family permease [Corallococcus sp.]
MENKAELQPETPDEARTVPTQKGFGGYLDRKFGLHAKGTSVKTEIMAGITTFMAMVYILMVNAGMFAELGEVSYGAMYITTALSAIIGTVLIGLLAGLPLAQAPGMGLNAFFVYTICFELGLSYANALVLVLIDGVVFVILTVTGLRKKIFKAIPDCVRKAIPAGIGLFIAFIGVQNAGIIKGHPSTLVSLQSLNLIGSATWATVMPFVVTLAGFIAIAVLSKLKVKGAILWGILGSAALYYLLGLTVPTFYQGTEYTQQYIWDALTKSWVLDPSFENGAANAFFLGYSATSQLPLVGQAGQTVLINYLPNTLSLSITQPFVDFGTQSVGQVFVNGFNFDAYLQAEGHSPAGLVLVIITSALAFCLVDMFDTLGTLYGACARGNLLDEKGEVPNMNRAMLADAIATTTGAILGTSTVTTFVESSSGVAEGGKTGLTSIVVAIGFFVAMFLSPIAQLVPTWSTAPALIYVGVLMMNGVREIEWTDPAVSVPAFMTIAMMVFAYNISFGIGFGIISYVLIKLCTGKVKEINIATAVIGAIFVAMFLLTH